jgi:hypothetical protein
MDSIGIVDVFSFMAYLSVGFSVLALILAFRNIRSGKTLGNTS